MRPVRYGGNVEKGGKDRENCVPDDENYSCGVVTNANDKSIYVINSILITRFN